MANRGNPDVGMRGTGCVLAAAMFFVLALCHCKPAAKARQTSGGNFLGNTNQPQDSADAVTDDVTPDPGITDSDDSAIVDDNDGDQDQAPSTASNEIKVGDFHLIFSAKGKIEGKTCVQLLEPRDIHSWDDNYLCGAADYGLQWHHQGVNGGGVCTQVYNLQDPYTWIDNYLCAPDDSHGIRYVQGEKPAGYVCLTLNETADPNAWDKAFLCVPEDGQTTSLPLALPVVQDLFWSSAQPSTTAHCILMYEPQEPEAHTWQDNRICMREDYGITWHHDITGSAASLSGACTQIVEAKDPNGWANNYLCASNDRYCLRWSSDGKERLQGMECVQIKEVAEPAAHSWDDNYLCVRKPQGYCPPLGFDTQN